MQKNSQRASYKRLLQLLSVGAYLFFGATAAAQTNHSAPVLSTPAVPAVIEPTAIKTLSPPSISAPVTEQASQETVIDSSTLAIADEKKSYKGEKISLNFQNIPVRDVLQILAEFTQKNVIISDSVKGNLTLTLKEVPWDQVLAFVLKSQGLAQRETHDILIIAPAKEIVTQEQESLASTQALETLAPLHTQSFSINYGKVDDYYALLQDPKQTLLSSRGHIVKLNNSNTLVVEDTAKKLASIAILFAKMDQPAKQVLIEARIVYVNTAYQRNLGIKWSTTGSSGIFKNFNMDLSTAAMNSSGAPTASTLGALSIGTGIGGLNLNLQLQAIELEGGGELVSSPRILTSNNVMGDIQQGQQVPYLTQAASGGTTVQYVQAVLELQVTPQITPNNKLLLNLMVTQNQVLPPLTPGGAPPISTRKLTTLIMVNNKQTIVLGGIYTRNKTSSTYQLPWLSHIPLIGNLFKSNVTVDNKDELLIFLTPKIIDVNEQDTEFDV
jgi:type IV pilus assembly protein PilQ